MTIALAMISGGLDSILAAKIIKGQGIEVIGICFKSYFFDEAKAKDMCKTIDIPLVVVDFSKEHFNMLKNPKHGYGKNMNPCIDCHAMMMKYTGELLDKYKADFIITGEVLNQRPMSQNKRSLDIVKKESGFSNKILRPLCALNLEPTDMETEGLVNREELLDISGRSRTRQMELAETFGIKDYPSPAGGCKLTEPNYSKRLKDLLKYNDNPDNKDIGLLRYGRHFRMGNSKIIVSRTRDESTYMKKLIKKEDFLFFPKDHPGSMVILTGDKTNEAIEFAANISLRYSKGNTEEKITVKYGNYGTIANKYIDAININDENINEYSINI
ncbi:tRNA (5-methyl aminomethyl-2-thiouridylate)-methyltransferase [Clostridium putrefaciens]|uniref:tRNA (5-methyl aminomethyl-2-thiouridylate)-methyltransferase n=1 Tax=Clostridium putrefaciens TaxID=99675 RepID=A0A381J8D6_9CLOT|nr:DUF814 domain-containing protein [Clostridium putrefaciens]SUY46657.1 tRNA (5-methyl aminomethyl-2-thiouridylate)-methyltransferase [Clostridium putrefaciens]